jgi:hypothetical protein
MFPVIPNKNKLRDEEELKETFSFIDYLKIKENDIYSVLI